ncbi:hypothetical protein [Aeromicrobium sp. CTD01-1L150]|uniref:hypothetical protein n=1 Tax=Aeromicrobium sp. CTD01-1L150 TaxID=3341830 RepID=UPI0035BFD29F
MKKTPRLLAAAGAAAALALVPTSANAAPLDIDYDATGHTVIASTGSTIEIAPTTLSTTVDSAGGPGSLTGTLPLAPSSVEFKALGFAPIKATVSYDEAAPVTGQLVRDGALTRVESTASYYIKLSNVRVAGIPAFVGNNCRTAEPVQIPANTPAGETFNIVSGGTLAGEFSIGDFQNCRLTTGMINLLIPGDGNTAEIEVSNGRIR